MSIETGIRAGLIGNSAVSALVGTRIYPVKLPQGYSLPAVTYQRVSGVRPRDTEKATGRVVARFQIDCHATTYQAARRLADAVRLCLDNHRGTLGSEANVGTIEIVGDRDGFNESTEESRVMLDFLVPYFETTT